MALKRLRTQEMVAVTSTWVDPEHADRRALAAVTALAGLLSELDAACHGLHVTFRAGLGGERRKQIKDRQRVLDLEHDDVVRGIWFYLQSQVCIARDPARRQELDRLRDRLLPEGLLAVNKSYREQAGQATLATSRLTEGDRELLRAMMMHDGRTLLDLVQRWLELGTQLGALDRERAGVAREDAPTAAEARAARNRWIRAVSAMREVAELVAADDAAIQQIFARLRRAEREADRRAAGEASHDTPDELSDELTEAADDAGDATTTH